MTKPLLDLNNDIKSQLAASPQAVADLCRSLRRTPFQIEGRLHMLLAAGVVCIDPGGLRETRYMLTTKAKPATSGPIQTSIAGARRPPSSVTSLTGYSAKLREFRMICMLGRR